MISATGLGKRFDERWVFREAELSVPKGGSAVLIGPSGGGKSVLLKVIAGLLPADEGRIELGTKNVGMLFQKNALFDSMTSEENLLFPLRERRGIQGEEGRKLAREMLESVGLGHAGPLFPDELSGGMQKRLGIARALIVEPEIILYDEPTAGLDPITSRMIADLIRQLREKSGATLLSVTTDMQRAYQLADRIYLVAQGRVSLGGSPAQVRATKDPALHQFIYGLKTGPLTATSEAL